MDADIVSVCPPEVRARQMPERAKGEAQCAEAPFVRTAHRWQELAPHKGAESLCWADKLQRLELSVAFTGGCCMLPAAHRLADSLQAEVL